MGDLHQFDRFVCAHLLAEEVLVEQDLDPVGNDPEPEVEQSECLRQTAVERLGNTREGRLIDIYISMAEKPRSVALNPLRSARNLEQSWTE